MYLLGNDDFVSVTGTLPVVLDINGGRGNDWIYVPNFAATITDLHGDNTISTGAGDDIIHTGPGNDEIDAGGGKNQITDDGGTNSIATGDQNDQIHHANAQDWIVAGAGVNDIWLTGVHQGWHNPVNAADVNRDGFVSPIDALLILNLLSRKGSHTLRGSADSVAYLYDANNDGFLAPIDVLIVITRISQMNRIIQMNRDNQSGFGEGENEVAADQARQSDIHTTNVSIPRIDTDHKSISILHRQSKFKLDGDAFSAQTVDACFATLGDSDHLADWFERVRDPFGLFVCEEVRTLS
jgi:hypothetical protein